MSGSAIAAVVGGSLLVGFAFKAMWPAKRAKPSAANKWHNVGRSNVNYGNEQDAMTNAATGSSGEVGHDHSAGGHF